MVTPLRLGVVEIGVRVRVSIITGVMGVGLGLLLVVMELSLVTDRRRVSRMRGGVMVRVGI